MLVRFVKAHVLPSRLNLQVQPQPLSTLACCLEHAAEGVESIMNYFKFAVRALAGACACACVYAQYEVCMLCACLMHVHVPNPLCMTILHSRLAGDPDGDEAGSTRAFASANEQQRYVNEELYKVLEEVMLEAGLEDSSPLSATGRRAVHETRQHTSRGFGWW